MELKTFLRISISFFYLYSKILSSMLISQSELLSLKSSISLYWISSSIIISSIGLLIILFNIFLYNKDVLLLFFSYNLSYIFLLNIFFDNSYNKNFSEIFLFKMK